MRYVFHPQTQIGETFITDIQFDIHSRDDIPQVLCGLQQIYKDTNRRDVESAINALEVHGLDRCPDHGIDGFKRYVA